MISISSATFDYYLHQNPDYSSYMDVSEVLTAEFPSTNQNHGIERCLPTRYRGVKTLDPNTISVTRNGSPEPFSKSSEENSLYCFRIGSASTYVTNTQTYQITYQLKNVILEPDNSSNQELYWDTNGTGWDLPFTTLTANVHLPDSLAQHLTGTPSCYVGTYGTSGPSATSRCSISKTTDPDTQLSFQTSDLAPGENLTLDLEFSPNTFYVKKDLRPLITGILATLGTLALSIASFFSHRRAKRKNAKKIALSKSSKPTEYIPPKNLTVAQAQKLWLHSSSADPKIATLLELAVTHHIKLEKSTPNAKLFPHTSWKIHLINIDNLPTEQLIVLKILNHAKPVSSGDIIEVKTQSYSPKTENLLSSFTSTVNSELKNKGLFEKTKRTYFLAPKYNKFEKRTLKGIETSNYLDGLKEYISLAETDRINFLHSVKTADISPQGIVKLYEKLLPYAIIFGCEKSWMEELEKYYQLPDVSEPNWMLNGIYLSSRDLRTFSTSVSSSVSSATVSSSSGSSGGGGGGFSGGGGGGGGGSAW